MLPTSLSPSLLSYSFLFSLSFPLLSISFSKLMNIGTVKSGSELFRKRRLLYPPIFSFLISIDSSLFTHHSDINKKMFDKKMTTSHPMSWGRSNYNSYKCIVSSSLRKGRWTYVNLKSYISCEGLTNADVDAMLLLIHYMKLLTGILFVFSINLLFNLFKLFRYDEIYLSICRKKTYLNRVNPYFYPYSNN